MEEKMRLQKYMSLKGICSRRKAEELISQGKVKVDGKVITQMGFLVDKSNQVEVEGYNNLVKQDLVTFVFNKPLGVVSSVKDDRGRRTIIDYFNKENYRLYPVGRLDYNTSGTILVSNDGELTNLVTHPSTHLNKTYLVKIRGQVKDEDIITLRQGVLLEDGWTQKAIVNVKQKFNDFTLIEITIHEGRNRQVRRMFEHFNYHVLELNRQSIAFINTKGLKRGEYRKLTDEEVNLLKQRCKENKLNNVIPDYKRK